MADNSKIQWTDATWNPVRGCSRVSPGCGGPRHQGGCYAEKIAARFSKPGQTFHGFAERTEHGGRWTGKLSLIDDMLTIPLRWKRPRKIFVNSMSDLFHENLSDEAIDKVFAVMALCPQHYFQVLTKRAERMHAYFEGPWAWRVMEAKKAFDPEHCAGRGGGLSTVGGALRNVWLGVSCERQQEADERIPLLLQTPAAIRFISAEPLLGPIDLRTLKLPKTGQFGTFVSAVATGGAGIFDHNSRRISDLPSLDWVIVGGESGPRARPMHPDWARSLRDQCAAAGVPFFFKQWGEWTPGENVERQRGIVDTCHWFDNRWIFETENLANCEGHVDDQPDLYRIGKKAAGRHLDGKEHSGFPLEGRR